MKYLLQFFVILMFSCIGELLNYFIPLPIPASIYGIVLLFIGLVTGIVPYKAVKETGHFLVEIMPVMFIPAGVGLMNSWGVLKPMLIPVSIVTVVVLIAVMGVTGSVAQFVIRRGNTRQEGESEK